MNALSLVPVLDTPRVTLSTLAKAMGPIAPRDLAKLLEAHKYPAAGPIRSYQTARRQAVDYLVDGLPFDATAPMRSYEREVVAKMMRLPPRVPEWSRGIRPSTQPSPWLVDDVMISMHADVELDARLHTGAVKFSFTKQPLSPGVGRLMAGLLWYWQARVLRRTTTATSHCLVFEPRLPWVHLPPRDPDACAALAKLACRTIRALWAVV